MEEVVLVVSPGTKFILIHIQKTGGSSVETLMRKLDPGIGSCLYQGRRHVPAREFRLMVPPEIWSSYRKIAFVRNPWDRLVSWHRMCVDRPDNPFQFLVRTRYPDFADFVRNLGQPDLAKVARCQLDFVVDAEDRMLVDFVGRFETLADDVARCGLDVTGGALPHVNKTRHQHYRSYYTDELRDLVDERFARDCAYFGYCF